MSLGTTSGPPGEVLVYFILFRRSWSTPFSRPGLTCGRDAAPRHGAGRDGCRHAAFLAGKAAVRVEADCLRIGVPVWLPVQLLHPGLAAAGLMFGTRHCDARADHPASQCLSPICRQCGCWRAMAIPASGAKSAAIR